MPVRCRGLAQLDARLREIVPCTSRASSFHARTGVGAAGCRVTMSSARSGRDLVGDQAVANVILDRAGL